jgi:WD40 repeat protein
MNLRQIEKYRRQLRNHMPLIGGWLQGQVLRTLAEDGSAEAVRLLAEAVAPDEDQTLSTAALELLRRLAERKNVAAQEALCRLVIHHNHPQARQIVAAAGYVPHDELQRSVFYFLTEQWGAYESLDFDRRLLREAYDAGDVYLRRRIATKARQAGRVEWVDMVAGGKQGRRLAVMTDEEWHSALTLLVVGKRWEDLWRLAQEAPPRWSAEILQRLKKMRWRGRAEDRAGFEELARLAKNWEDMDFSRVLQHKATLKGHGHEIRCLALTGSNSILASGSADQTVRLWSLPDGQPLKTLEGHGGWVHCLAISPDELNLASAGRDGRICLWRLPSGRLLRKLRGHKQSVFCLAINPEGDLLVSGGSDNTVRLWDLPRGEPRQVLQGHTCSVSCLVITPDGALLASGSADCTVRLWSLPRGRALRTLEGHRNGELDTISCLAISPDGQLLASGGTDGTIRLWSLPDGRPLKTLRAHRVNVASLVISPAGDLLASGGGDHVVRLWELPSGRVVDRLEGHTSANNSLVMSPDGRFLASSSGGGLGLDHTVRLWDLTGRQGMRILSGHNRYVNCLAMSQDGRLLASGSGDCTIRLWSAELHRLIHLPVGQATLKDLEWVQAQLQRKAISKAERKTLEFIAALIRWRRRSDILVEEGAARVIELGEFDIEIEG